MDALTEPGGQPVSAGDVFAAEVTAGDQLLLDDGILAAVIYVRHGLFWLPDDLGQGAKLGQGVGIDWKQSDGNAQGTLIRPPGDVLRRVGYNS